MNNKPLMLVSVISQESSLDKCSFYFYRSLTYKEAGHLGEVFLEHRLR